VRLLNSLNAPAPQKRRMPLMLPLLALLLSACAAPLRVTDSSSVPPLPQEARPPQKPSWCLPSCSVALRILLDSLTQAVRPEKPAQPLTIK